MQVGQAGDQSPSQSPSDSLSQLCKPRACWEGSSAGTSELVVGTCPPVSSSAAKLELQAFLLAEEHGTLTRQPMGTATQGAGKGRPRYFLYPKMNSVSLVPIEICHRWSL